MPKLAKSTVEKLTLRELSHLKARLESERVIHDINGERNVLTTQNLRVVNNELAARKEKSDAKSIAK